MFITLILVSQVYAYVQIHQILYIKHVVFLYTNYISVKLFRKTLVKAGIEMSFPHPIKAVNKNV